jgi:hypothetical protein
VKPDRPDREARLALRVLLERLDLKASAGPVGLRDPLVLRAKLDLRELLELPVRRVSKGPRDLQDLLVRRVSPDLRDRQGLLGLPDPLDLLGQQDQPKVLRHLVRDRRSSLPQFD